MCEAWRFQSISRAAKPHQIVSRRGWGSMAPEFSWKLVSVPMKSRRWWLRVLFALLDRIRTMEFALSAIQQSVSEAIGRICDRFDDAYWLKRDREGGFPNEFYDVLANEGWLGICTAQAYGGAGLGIMDAAVMMRTIAESGAGLSGS